MAQKYVAPRVRALLARESPQALLICRSRSKLVVTVGWDRSTDRFTIGQWMKGRIEACQADISPDGQHWIYSGYRPQGHLVTERWTAIAKVPYLKALAFGFCGGPGGPHGGGGLFLDNRTYYTPDSFFVSDKKTLQPQIPGVVFSEGLLPSLERQESFFAFRLRRDGWRRELRPTPFTTEELEWMAEAHERTNAALRQMVVEKPSVFRPDAREIYSRPFQPPTQRYLLRSLPDGWELEAGHCDGDYPKTYRLLHAASGQAIEHPSWLWADWDPIGQRLVWAEDGFIRAARIAGDRIEPPRDLFDSNPLRFEAIAAPY